MRITIQFRLASPLVLPLNYHEILQGFIYHQMEDKAFSQFLHEKGYMYGKRSFKFFTFSRLMGRAFIDRKKKTIMFKEHVRWQVSSCLPKFIQEFGRTLLKKEDLYLSGHPVEVEELHCEPLKISQFVCTVRMLSPITVHSTYESGDGRKITQYFSPYDPAFRHLINENLARKYFAYYEKPLPGKIGINPVRLTKKDKVITRFKGFVIEAWNGVYQLEGDPEALAFACTVGLGGRNSQGFGLPVLCK